MKKHKSSYLVTIFYYVINTVYIYSWKQTDKILTHFGDILCRKFIYIYIYIAHGLQLDNRVTPWVIM